MAEFMTNLFNSIFTPGPTPTLVVATNASFAALQLVLLGLVIATYNVHFVVLSVLCGGLWWAINWFTIELEASKQQQHQKEESQNSKQSRSGPRPKRQEPPEESGTETEEAGASISTAVVDPVTAAKENLRLRPEPADEDRLKKRASFGGDVSGTDSEWDKVSENEGSGLL